MTATTHITTTQPALKNNRVESLQTGTRMISPEISAEEKLTDRILRDGNGRGLMKFCRELSVILIRQYSKDDDAADLREGLVPSLKTTLNCSDQQAHSLIDLALEMIHAKVHGKYRRSDIELGALIAIATGAVTDATAN